MNLFTLRHWLVLTARCHRELPSAGNRSVCLP